MFWEIAFPPLTFTYNAIHITTTLLITNASRKYNARARTMPAPSDSNTSKPVGRACFRLPLSQQCNENTTSRLNFQCIFLWDRVLNTSKSNAPYSFEIKQLLGELVPACHFLIQCNETTTTAWNLRWLTLPMQSLCLSTVAALILSALNETLKKCLIIWSTKGETYAEFVPVLQGSVRPIKQHLVKS